MNENNLKAILARNPQLTVSEGDQNPRQLSSTKPKRGTENEMVGVEKGKAESMVVPKVSFTFYRCRLLDVDGFRGGEKDLLDGLVKSGLLPGDEVGKIELDPPQQIKVTHRYQEETVITIRYE